MNDVVSERLRILLAKRSRTRCFNLATREPPPKDIVLAARVYADNGPHLVVVGRDCHPRSPHDIENSEIARVVDFLYSERCGSPNPLRTAPGSETARATTSRTDLCVASSTREQSAINWSRSNIILIRQWGMPQILLK